MPWRDASGACREVLIHLAAGTGNIVLATPLVLAVSRAGYVVDLLLDADYPDTAALVEGWGAVRRVLGCSDRPLSLAGYWRVLPAVPPFYWQRYRGTYRANGSCVPRPPDALFYRDEQAYYLAFAEALGCRAEPRAHCFLPVAARYDRGVTSSTLVLAPGCKTGEMAAKRWPHFPALAEAFDDVVVVGTADDLSDCLGRPLRFPAHVRSLAGTLSLRETAEVLAAAGAVVANDSGLGHVSAAVGTPTVMLFGPTPHLSLGELPPNVLPLRTGLPCEPCWFRARLAACGGRIDCLAGLAVAVVAEHVRASLALGAPDDGRRG